MKKGTKYISGLIVALVFLLSAGTYADSAVAAGNGSQGGNGKQKVVAKVNGVEITQGDVDMMTSTLEPPRQGDFGTERSVEEIRKDALDKLIMSELLYQKAKALGLSATAEEMDHALAKFKRGLGGDDGFQKFLESQGITEKDVKTQMERSITIRNLMEKEIFKNIAVDEKQMKKEYEKDRSVYTRPESITAVDVILFLNPVDPASRARAEEILNKIKADPAHDPRVLSPDGSFVVRDLTINKEKEPVLYEAAKKVGAGGLSDLLTSDGTLHIIKVKEYTPFKQYSFEESKGFAARRIRQREQQKRLQEWEVKLKKEAKIEMVPAGGSGEKGH